MKATITILAMAMLIIAGCASQVQVTNFKECVAAGNPVMESHPRQCAHNGVTYIEEIIYPTGEAIFCLSEQRGEVICTRDYTPVCGSNGQTYGNACTACSEPTVEFHTPGECPTEITFCLDEQRGAEICTMEYMPVCGNDGQTYGNTCMACANEEVEYYTGGEC